MKKSSCREAEKGVKQEQAKGEALRECLKCSVDEKTGIAPLFLSKSPYNRICDKHSNSKAAIDVSNLSRIGAPIEGLDFSVLGQEQK